VGWVDPGLARDSVATFTAAQDLWRAVGRANILITIPATTQGLQAFRSLITEGINVHVALIPSERRYRQTLDAYVAALETRQGRGLPLAVHSVASLAAPACTPDGTALADAAWRIFEAQGATPRLRQLNSRACPTPPLSTRCVPCMLPSWRSSVCACTPRALMLLCRLSGRHPLAMTTTLTTS
jgi:hypothetical protein